MGQITATRNLVATKVVRLAGQSVTTSNRSQYVTLVHWPYQFRSTCGLSVPVGGGNWYGFQGFLGNTYILIMLKGLSHDIYTERWSFHGVIYLSWLYFGLSCMLYIMYVDPDMAFECKYLLFLIACNPNFKPI